MFSSLRGSEAAFVAALIMNVLFGLAGAVAIIYLRRRPTRYPLAARAASQKTYFGSLILLSVSLLQGSRIGGNLRVWQYFALFMVGMALLGVGAVGGIFYVRSRIPPDDFQALGGPDPVPAAATRVVRRAIIAVSIWFMAAFLAINLIFGAVCGWSLV